MNTAKRDRIILSVLIIAIICVVMFYISVKPNMDKMDSLNSQISSARASIDSLKSKSALINDLKKQLEEIEAQVKTAEGEMADFDDYSLYLSDFQDITEKATETKINFSSTAPSASGYYTVVQAKISFVCDYDDFKDIMTALLSKKAHCYDVNITVGDRTADGSVVKVSFIADYISRVGSYVEGDYEFTSGDYGLEDLFNGNASGITTNTNTNTDENTDNADE